MGNSSSELRATSRRRHPELDRFGDAVRVVMAERGLRLADVAAGGGLSRSCLCYNMQRGRGRTPSLTVFFAVADGLGVDAPYLLGRMRELAGTEV